MSVFFLPHYLFFLIYKKKYNLDVELSEWSKVLRISRKTEMATFFWLIKNLKEYRSTFYFRLGQKRSFPLRIFFKGMPTLFFITPKDSVGVGLVIQHGHSTRVGAKSIGKNCQIWHNVTIGRGKSGGERPVIGEGVKICTGSIVLGDITIGNNVTIGAGSVVLKSIPDDCVVVGNPARIVKKRGIRIDEPLV